MEERDLKSGLWVGERGLLPTVWRITSIRAGFEGGTGFAAGCISLTSIYLSGCSRHTVVSDEVRKGELRHLVVEARPKRSRDKSTDWRAAMPDTLKNDFTLFCYSKVYSTTMTKVFMFLLSGGFPCILFPLRREAI